MYLALDDQITLFLLASVLGFGKSCGIESEVGTTLLSLRPVGGVHLGILAERGPAKRFKPPCEHAASAVCLRGEGESGWERDPLVTAPPWTRCEKETMWPYGLSMWELNEKAHRESFNYLIEALNGTLL